MMRWLVLLLFVSGAMAQGATWSTTDPSGDVAADGDVPVPGAAFPMADIVAAGVDEGEDTLSFWVTSAALGSAAGADLLVDSASFALHFGVGERPYFLDVYPIVGTEQFQGVLYQGEATDPDAETIYYQEATVDGDTLRVEVPRELLVDPDGQTVNPLVSINGLYATSKNQLRPGFGEETRMSGVADRAPDAEADDGTMVPLLGLEQTGPLRLSSPRPFRASNGLATTYAIQANLTDGRASGDAAPVSFEALEVPSDWSVQIVPGRLESLPGQVHDLVVLVGVPDRHEHGEQIHMKLRAIGPGAWSTILPFGVTFVDPPLPSGHHPDLYLHSSLGGATVRTSDDAYLAYTRGFLSTAEADERDTVEPVGLRDICPVASSDPAAACYSMTANLASDDLGLVRILDPASFEGELVFPNAATVPQSARGRVLVHWAHGWERYEGFTDEELLWQSDWADLPISGTGASIQESLPAVAGPLRFDAQDGGRLYLTVELEAIGPSALFYGSIGVDYPALTPGAHLRLPLGEYHDDVAEIVSTQGFHIKAPDRVSVAVDVPTEIRFEVHDTVGDAQGLEAIFEGPAAVWIDGEPKVSFADGTGEVVVRLQAKDGRVGQTSSLALAVRDPVTGAAGALTVPVEVVPSSEVAPAVSESRDSPAPLPLLVVFVALAFWRRRPFTP